MSWSRFDDLYDEHEKVLEGWFAHPPNPVALHVMATTAANRWLSDGVIRPRWLNFMLPDAKKRNAVLETAWKVGLFDLLPAGESRTVHDSDGNAIELGPFDEDRYIVHDFLDRHDSSVQIKAKRQADAARKRTGRQKDSVGSPVGVQPDSARTPDGRQADSERSPVASRARPRVAPAPPSLPIPTQQPPPSPPKGGRQRDKDDYQEALAAYASEHFGDIADQAAAAKAVEQAVHRVDARTVDDVRAFIDRFWPQLNAEAAA